jgi:hypothetical protein
MVELSDSLGGPVISSYAVQDKQQVADLDPSMIPPDEDEGDTHNGPCMVCETYGDDSELMYCDGCSNTCHIACAGLDSLPPGTWFCYTCQHDPQILANNRGGASSPRSRRNRAGRFPMAWERVWRSVYDRLDFDLDFPFTQEDTAAQRRAESERREIQEWRRRFEVAARQGAATRFRDTAVILREHQRNRPTPESQEEIKAWNAFERMRALEEGGEQLSRSRRKRKSPTASPREAPTEPERKLKRPRTRKPQITGDASETAGESSRSTLPPVAPSAPRPRRVQPEGAGPTFLQSLLSEVEAHPLSSGPDIEPFEYNSDAGSRFERSPSPRFESSPDASPAASNHPSPRAMTPPPHSPVARPASPPPLTSIITPVFPPAPEFSPFSPVVEDSVDRARSRQRQPAGSSPSHSPNHSPTRAPISYEMKTEIQKMVSVALKPHYHRKEVDKEGYTDINRDVSRMLYDKVWDAGGLVDSAARDRWQKVAAEEVALAVKALKDTEATPPAVDAPEVAPTFTAVVRA